MEIAALQKEIEEKRVYLMVLWAGRHDLADEIKVPRALLRRKIFDEEFSIDAEVKSLILSERDESPMNLLSPALQCLAYPTVFKSPTPPPPPRCLLQHVRQPSPMLPTLTASSMSSIMDYNSQSQRRDRRELLKEEEEESQSQEIEAQEIQDEESQVGAY